MLQHVYKYIHKIQNIHSILSRGGQTVFICEIYELFGFAFYLFKFFCWNKTISFLFIQFKYFVYVFYWKRSLNFIYIWNLYMIHKKKKYLNLYLCSLWAIKVLKLEQRDRYKKKIVTISIYMQFFVINILCLNV